MRWYVMVCDGMRWYVMVWDGMVWYGMVWYGMVWYGDTISRIAHFALVLWTPRATETGSSGSHTQQDEMNEWMNYFFLFFIFKSYVMVCDGMRWYAMVCDGMVIPYHSDPSRNCARVFTKNALIVNSDFLATDLRNSKSLWTVVSRWMRVST